MTTTPAAPNQHIHPESVTALSYSQNSVSKAAQTKQEEKLNQYCLLLLLVRFSMLDAYGTPLPEDVQALLSGQGGMHSGQRSI